MLASQPAQPLGHRLLVHLQDTATGTMVSPCEQYASVRVHHGGPLGTRLPGVAAVPLVLLHPGVSAGALTSMMQSG